MGFKQSIGSQLLISFYIFYLNFYRWVLAYYQLYFRGVDVYLLGQSMRTCIFFLLSSGSGWRIWISYVGARISILFLAVIFITRQEISFYRAICRYCAMSGVFFIRSSLNFGIMRSNIFIKLSNKINNNIIIHLHYILYLEIIRNNFNYQQYFRYIRNFITIRSYFQLINRYFIYQEMTLDIKAVLEKSAKSGTAGATAMTIQVLSLMWMRTTMNYQFKNGGGFIPTLRKLYSQGGIMRFYRGVVPALIIGPIARFGDTAANMLARDVFKSYNLSNLPIFVQTSLGSVLAGIWRLSTLPVDAWKTSKQVHGQNGLKMLIEKYRANGVKAFYQGGIASATATMVGHYPWFVTNNYLDYYIPKYSFKQQTLKALVRSAFIGFCCTMVSDTISNSVRVMKTVKQTSQKQITYAQAFNEVVSKDGYTGLLFRGLKTKLLTNGVQGVIFSIAWRYFQERLKVGQDKK